MVRFRERAWAMCQLARIDACDRRENLAIARYGVQRMRMTRHLGTTEPKAREWEAGYGANGDGFS